MSPLLANLFLHYAFDRWVAEHLRSVRFCRYADDGVVHCKSLAQAQLALRRIGGRFRQCGLELHPEKTRIVYCKDINRPEDYPTTAFTFLGYTFRPRKAVDKYGRVYVNFAPAVSPDALKAMRQTIRGWHLQLKCDKELRDLSVMFNPVLRGWLHYYGRFHGSAMASVWKHLNAYLARWLMRKYKHCKRRSKNVPLKRPDGPVVAVPKCTALKSSEESGSKQDLRPEEARGGCIRWRCMSGFDGHATSRG
jgi:RNA-directed DNA polymerase